MPEPSQELSDVLARASELAGARWISAANFVQALEASAEVVEVLRRCGISSAELHATAAAADLPEDEQTDDARFGRELRVAMDMAKALAARADRRTFRSTDVLGALLAMTPAPRFGTELRSRGLSVLRLRRVAVHGVADYEPAAPPPGESCAVRLYNDPFTTREFVVNALIVFFELDESSAVNLMLAVHENGGAALGPLPAARAVELIEHVHRSAAEQDFPLRLTLEEPGVLEALVETQAQEPTAEMDGLAWERPASEGRDDDRMSKHRLWIGALVLVVMTIALLQR